MDDLYENLDNYNEGNTIAELQAENKELKSKLEEYAVTLTNLQKEFDKLSLEYKQLEHNYSSLLKTAKAEVERKTQIITNLNLEKDKMVLKSFQNKNAGAQYKSRDYGNSMLKQNPNKHNIKDQYENNIQDDKLKHFEGRKSATQRNDQDEPPSKDTPSSPHPDLRSKLLNLAYRGQQNDPRTEKNSEVKENIMQPHKDGEGFKARASISNRRKSMPAISMEMEQFSDDDDDLVSGASSNNLQQTSTEHKFSEKHQHDHHFYERPRSRISETSSLEEKKSGYQEPMSDNHKQRYSRYDGDKNDKYRVRHKSAHRYKRRSPEKYQTGSREYHDSYRRLEHDRHRAKGLESPPRDKFYQRASRDLHHNYERSHPYEHERLIPRSQERYQMKRRIEHSYDELENKRVRLEPHSRHSEENRRMESDNKRLKMESHSRYPDGDRRMRDERKPQDKKYMADPLEIQFSSCESPDYVYPDNSNQQIKEIKLTATTKLDDPRISSKKYVVKKNDNQVVLTTAIGRDVDIVPVRKIAWGITPVSMPEALVNRPLEPKPTVKDVCIETKSTANISIESGEISDLDDMNTENYLRKANKLRIPNIKGKEPPVPVPKLEDSKDVDKSLRKMNSYKIPKRKKSVDDKQSSKQCKEITLPVKPIQENTNSFKSKKNLDIANKDIVLDKLHAKSAKGKKEPEGHKQDSFIAQSKNRLSCIETSNINEQKSITAKEIVEGDLEMSDDNCDDNTQSEHVSKEPVLSTELENKTMIEDKNCSSNKEKQPVLQTSQKILSDASKDKIPTCDSKKSKTKKKSKNKEIKDVLKSEDSTKVFEKPAKKKEKKKDTKSIQIKTKFSELFDDSNSLISPEDLGLGAVPPPTTKLPDKCVPFFEDAQDAADLNTIKCDTIIDPIPEKSNVESKPINDVTVTEIDTPTTVIQDDSLEKSNDRSIDVPTEMTDDVIKSIYQNLEPGVPEEPDNVVKTVIISTGVQPPVLLEDEKLVPSCTPNPLTKTIQDIGLKALATSTPHKVWQPEQDVADIETKLDTGCTSNHVSQTASVENSAIMDKSESNTMDSQTNDANVPDVRIFVKRRRKGIKK